LTRKKGSNNFTSMKQLKSRQNWRPRLSRNMKSKRRKKKHLQPKKQRKVLLIPKLKSLHLQKLQSKVRRVISLTLVSQSLRFQRSKSTNL